MSMNFSENLFREFISGGFGGFLFVTVGHPFDTLKVRVQVLDFKENTGFLKSTKNILKNEGFISLYRGISAPLICVAAIYAFSFVGYSAGKSIQTPNKNNNQEFSLFQLFCAGMVSGCCSSLITPASERIKCLLQVQAISATNSYKFHGTIHCVRTLYKQGGFASLYKGTYATLMRDIPSTGIYFASYELIKDACATNETLKSIKSLIAGGLAGCIYWITALPIDVAKSRFQTAPEGKYKNLLNVYVDLLKINGFRAFYKGLTPVLIRSFPANAICFYGYEFSYKNFFQKF